MADLLADPCRRRARARPCLPRATVAAMLIACASLTACAVGPDFTPPDPPPVADYLPPDGRPPGRIYAPGADIPACWWELFQSRHLNELIELAIQHNAD